MVLLPMTLIDPWLGFQGQVVLKGEYIQNDAFYTHTVTIGRK